MFIFEDGYDSEIDFSWMNDPSYAETKRIQSAKRMERKRRAEKRKREEEEKKSEVASALLSLGKDNISTGSTIINSEDAVIESDVIYTEVHRRMNIKLPKLIAEFSAKSNITTTDYEDSFHSSTSHTSYYLRVMLEASGAHFRRYTVHRRTFPPLKKSEYHALLSLMKRKGWHTVPNEKFTNGLPRSSKHRKMIPFQLQAIEKLGLQSKPVVGAQSLHQKPSNFRSCCVWRTIAKRMIHDIP